jgi:hypothetical protein
MCVYDTSYYTAHKTATPHQKVIAPPPSPPMASAQQIKAVSVTLER